MHPMKITAIFLLAFACLSQAGPTGPPGAAVLDEYEQEFGKKLDHAAKEIISELKETIGRLSDKVGDTASKVAYILKDFLEHADIAGTVKKISETLRSSFKDAIGELGETLKKTLKEEYDRSLLKFKEKDIAGSLSDLLKKSEKEVNHLIEVIQTQTEKLLKESKEICNRLRADPRYKEYQKEIQALEDNFIEQVEKIGKSLGFKESIGDTLRTILEQIRTTRKAIERKLEEQLLKKP